MRSALNFFETLSENLIYARASLSAQIESIEKNMARETKRPRGRPLGSKNKPKVKRK